MEKNIKISEIHQLWCSNCDGYYNIEVENDEILATFCCIKCGGRLVKIIGTQNK